MKFFMLTTIIPEKQRTVQLVAPDQFRVNDAKPVFQHGPHQILCQIEVGGIRQAAPLTFWHGDIF